jgi:hypothetical protein
MCHGDMTPAPVIWSERRNGVLPIFDTEHTCRDYDALKKWVVDRDAVNENIALENAARLKAKSVK